MPTSTSRTSLPAWKRRLFRILAVLLPLLSLEAAARIYWVQWVEPHKSDSELYQEALGEKVLGDEVPYQFFANRDFTVASTPTRTNNLALRGDDDIDLSVEYHGTRILCVGDSVTFGYTVSGNRATYPSLLERRLRSQGVQCQVLNAGMPRYRMEHLAILFDDHLQHYDADLMVVLGGWNNANDHVLRPAAGRSWGTFLNDHWFMLKVARHLDFLPQLGEHQHLPARIDPTGYVRYGESLRRLIQSARQAGVRPIVSTLPHFFHNLDERAARNKAATFTPLGTLEQLATVADAMNATIREVAEETKTPVVDLASVNKHTLFADAIHPNDEGSAAVAEQIAVFLLERGQMGP